jgi:hypothetical protein
MIRLHAGRPNRYYLCPGCGAVKEDVYRDGAIVDQRWHDAPDGTLPKAIRGGAVTDNKAEKIVTSLIPNAAVRRRCLSVFLESMIEADKHGASKWGAYCENDVVRLLVGSLIVLTIHRGEVWVTLDRQQSEESQDLRHTLERSPEWDWDTGRWRKYKAVPSVNGYYTPSKDLQL